MIIPPSEAFRTIAPSHVLEYQGTLCQFLSSRCKNSMLFVIESGNVPSENATVKKLSQLGSIYDFNLSQSQTYGNCGEFVLEARLLSQPESEEVWGELGRSECSSQMAVGPLRYHRVTPSMRLETEGIRNFLENMKKERGRRTLRLPVQSSGCPIPPLAVAMQKLEGKEWRTLDGDEVFETKEQLKIFLKNTSSEPLHVGAVNAEPKGGWLCPWGIYKKNEKDVWELKNQGSVVELRPDEVVVLEFITGISKNCLFDPDSPIRKDKVAVITGALGAFENKDLRGIGQPSQFLPRSSVTRGGCLKSVDESEKPIVPWRIDMLTLRTKDDGKDRLEH